MARDWAGLERLKQRAWMDAQARRTPEQRIAVASTMRQHAHAVRPDLDWAMERADDLASHIKVAQLLRRADVRSHR